MQIDSSSINKSPERALNSCLFILMGASNLARGYRALTHCLVSGLAPQRVEVFNAMGPGRGYCAWGGIFNIRYPSIGSSGILESARAHADRDCRVVALITDIGNDIMYGVPASEIIACLDTLLQKLNALNAEVFVHPIPLDFSKDVSKRQFRILKTIFYPRSAIDYHQAQEAVSAINDFLRTQAGGRIHLLPGAKDFCGVDKIHYSIFRSHKAWSRVAHEMFQVLNVPKTRTISLWATLISLVANMGRLVFYDMTSVKKKPPQTF